MGSGVAEAQIDDLSDAEIDVLLEIYEVLRLTPDNGRKLTPTGNMYVWDYKGISVTYILLDPQGEVAVLRVGRFPSELRMDICSPMPRTSAVGRSKQPGSGMTATDTCRMPVKNNGWAHLHSDTATVQRTNLRFRRPALIPTGVARKDLNPYTHSGRRT
jgi:hypothetical protein